MCIGVPMRSVSQAAGIAICEGRGRRESINVLLVGDVEPGSWVLTFQGSALRRMSAEEAAQTDAALDALEAVMAGDAEVDISAHFADLLGREPELPPHLRDGRK